MHTWSLALSSDATFSSTLWPKSRQTLHKCSCSSCASFTISSCIFKFHLFPLKTRLRIIIVKQPQQQKQQMQNIHAAWISICDWEFYDAWKIQAISLIQRSKDNLLRWSKHTRILPHCSSIVQSNTQIKHFSVARCILYGLWWTKIKLTKIWIKFNKQRFMEWCRLKEWQVCKTLLID